MGLMGSLAAKCRIGGEMLRFFWRSQWWWLTPAIFVLLALGILLVVTQSSAIAPFIYTLF